MVYTGVSFTFVFGKIYFHPSLQNVRICTSEWNRVSWIRETTGYSFVLETEYLNSGFSWFSSVFVEKLRDIAWNKQPSTFFTPLLPNHRSIRR
jgi:hypothetical protein